jgi:hypothetical protein
VPSNLDRLPPNSLRKNKRKSQAKAHDSDPPRKRGRPRLSEQRRVEAENKIQQDASAEQAAALEKNTVMNEETSKMVTRRSTRQSAAATVNTTSPVEPTLQELTPDESTMDERPKDTEFEEDETMVDVGDEETTACYQASPLTSTQAQAKPSSPTVARAKRHAAAETPTPSSKNTMTGMEKVDPSSFGMSKTSSGTKRLKRSKPETLEPRQVPGAMTNGTSKTAAEIVTEPTDNTRETPTPAAKRKLTNGTLPAPLAKDTAVLQSATKIEYFARIHTSTGVQEIPVTLDDLVDDIEIVQKYAEWMENEGVQIPYKNFKSIFGFAKKV